MKKRPLHQFATLLAAALITTGALAAPVASDTSGAAPAITENSTTCDIDFLAYTMNGADEPLLPPGSNKPLHSGWWTFTPTETGYATFDTLANVDEGLGDNKDTMLVLYKKVNGSPQFLAYSDSFAGTYHAKIGAYLTAGTTYYIECGTDIPNPSPFESIATMTLRFTPMLSANYRGFIRAGIDPSQHAFFQVTRTIGGLLSGKVITQGKARSFLTAIDADGFASYTFPGSGDGAFPPVQMDLDCAGDGSALMVRLTVFGEASNPTFAALYRERRYPKASPSLETGTYTFSHGAIAPIGFGAFTMKVTSSGSALISGRAGDGSPISIGTKECETASGVRAFPFYKSLFAGKGVFAGVVTLQPGQLNTGLGGTTAFLRPAVPGKSFFPGGFNATCILSGGRYYPPLPAKRVLPSLDPTGNGLLSGLAGEFMAFATTGTLSPQNRFLFPSALFRPSIRVNVRTGIVTGTILPPMGNKPQRLFGIVINGAPATSEVRAHYTGSTRTTAAKITK